MSKFKFTSPFTLGAIASLGAMSILGAPIGAPLMLGALGLVALGRNSASAIELFSPKTAPLASYVPPEAASNNLSPTDYVDYTEYNEEELEDGDSTQDSVPANDLVTAEQDKSLQSDLSSSRKLFTSAPTPSSLPAYVVNNGNSSEPNFSCGSRLC